MISSLIIAEFTRQNNRNGLNITKEEVMLDLNASQLIDNESKNASQVIYGGLRCRVKVVGSMKQDLNGRLGTLRSFVIEQGKFCVGLDTKKRQDSDVQLFMPEDLEALSKPTDKAGKHLKQSYIVDIKHLLDGDNGGIGCHFTLEKTAVDALRSSKSIDAGLQAFCLERDKMEERLRLELEEERIREEEYRKQEEIDRERRAARKAKERAEEEEASQKWHRERADEARAEFERMDAEREAVQNLRERLHCAFTNKMRLRLLFLKAAANGIDPDYFHDYLQEEGIKFEYFDSDDESFFDSYSEFFEEMEDDYDEHVREDSVQKDMEATEILGENCTSESSHYPCT